MVQWKPMGMYLLRVGIFPQERLDDQWELRFDYVQVAGHSCDVKRREIKC